VYGNAIAEGTLFADASSKLVAYASATQTSDPQASPANAGRSPSSSVTAGGVSTSGLVPGAQVASPDDAVAVQMNAQHDGDQPADLLSTPLQKRWSVDLGGHASYPLIASGVVYALSTDIFNGATWSAVRLRALDASTGKTLWGPETVGTLGAWDAYDAGRLFVYDWQGSLSAYDASSGTKLWSVSVSSGRYNAAPTAANGVVYLGAAQVAAYSEMDGKQLWASQVKGDATSPAVTSSGVFAAYVCEQDYDFAPSNGATIWHNDLGCSGGGSVTPVVHAGRLYVSDSSPFFVSAALDTAQGSFLGTFAADAPFGSPSAGAATPAFDGDMGLYLNGTTLVGVDVASGQVKWSFFGNGKLVSAPVVANGIAYVGATDGTLYGLNAGDGTLLWSTNAGAAFQPQRAVWMPGNAVAEGALFVSADTRLLSYVGKNVGIPSPTVTGISPIEGPTVGGTTATITGSGFAGPGIAVTGLHVGSVYVNARCSGQPCFHVDSPTQLTVVMPPSSTIGAVDITVTTTGGTSATSLADKFIYLPL
jgi:outer membrane protein assembly factor BamB